MRDARTQILSRLLYGLTVLMTVAGTSVAAADSVRIAVVGDSLTEGLGVRKEEAFPDLLQKKFRESKAPVEVINMGTSGATSASGPSRVRFASKLNPKPQVLVLALGANDGLRGLSAEAMKKNLLEAVTLAQAAGMKVFLVGMKMPSNYPQKERSRFEAVFREVAREKKTGFLPFLLEGVAANPKLNQSDQLHPNAEGHRRIAEHLYPSLRKFSAP